MYRSTDVMKGCSARMDCGTGETYGNLAATDPCHALTDARPAATDRPTAPISRRIDGTATRLGETYGNTGRLSLRHARQCARSAQCSRRTARPLGSTAECSRCTAHLYRRIDGPSGCTAHPSLRTDDADHTIARGTTASDHSKQPHRKANALPPRRFTTLGHHADAHGGRFHLRVRPSDREDR